MHACALAMVTLQLTCFRYNKTFFFFTRDTNYNAIRLYMGWNMGCPCQGWDGRLTRRSSTERKRLAVCHQKTHVLSACLPNSINHYGSKVVGEPEANKQTGSTGDNVHFRICSGGVHLG